MKNLKLKLLTLCDLAMVSKEGKLSVIGMFDRIFTKKVPSSFIRLFIVAIVEGEPRAEYEIELNVQDPKGKKILPPKALKIKLSITGRSNLITDIANMPLSEFGEYKLDLKSENKTLGTTAFWVSRIGGQNEGKKGKLPN